MQKKRDVNKKPKRLANEIIKFYVAELTLYGIENLSTTLQNEGKELLPQDRAKLTDLRNRATRTIEQIFRWIREYLVYAVDSELKNQDCLPKKYHVNLPRLKYPKKCGVTQKVDKFLIYATEVEIRSYLKKASICFNKKGWAVAFGGKKWEIIAQIAFEMWSADSINQKCLLIDRTFQIEHNGGMIFDKRSNRILSNENRDKKILTLKRRSRTLDSLLKALMNRATNLETKNLIAKLVESLKALENSKRKNSLGGD